jgi:hypothetical protein
MKTASTSQPAVLIALMANIRVSRQIADDSIGNWEPATGILRGLCVNCDRRYDCTYPKPPSGVWSCDEYV